MPCKIDLAKPKTKVLFTFHFTGISGASTVIILVLITAKAYCNTGAV